MCRTAGILSTSSAGDLTASGIISIILGKLRVGLEMTDIVHYALPFGFIGNLAHPLFVRRQLEGIFRFRFQRVEELFGRYAPA